MLLSGTGSQLKHYTVVPFCYQFNINKISGLFVFNYFFVKKVVFFLQTCHVYASDDKLGLRTVDAYLTGRGDSFAFQTDEGFFQRFKRNYSLQCSKHYKGLNTVSTNDYVCASRVKNPTTFSLHNTTSLYLDIHRLMKRYSGNYS